jgi:hypothetical protein
MNSFFKHSFLPNKSIKQTNYISSSDWIEERQMHAVLLELSKHKPDTRKLYYKYLNRQIGWTKNRLDKHNIIQNYLKLTKSNYIISIIYNFKKNGKYIMDNYNDRYIKDKNLILEIIQKYIKETTIKYVYDTLSDIIISVNEDKIELNPYFINKLLEAKMIQTYHPSIINDILYYRKFEKYNTTLTPNN